MLTANDGECIKSHVLVNERGMKNMSYAQKKIYVILSDLGPIKIGISANPSNRCSELQIGIPFSVHVAYVSDVPNKMAMKIEKRAHAILAEYNTSGEWFNTTVECGISAIKQAIEDVCSAHSDKADDQTQLTPRERGRGRPPSPSSEKKISRNLYMDPPTRDRLSELSEEAGVPYSHYVSMLINRAWKDRDERNNDTKTRSSIAKAGCNS
jgi:hypothetical protein